MHQWGDEWFEKHGESLDAAVMYLARFAKRWGRLGGQAKEKFGTLRFYAKFHSQLHDLVYVGHYYIRWGRFGQALDSIYMRKFFNPVRSAIAWYQIKIYRAAYKSTLKKFPHLRMEILCDADYDEFLGGL